VQFLHPVTKEELHSGFFFSDLQRWEYTPKVFCFWSTKCDFLDEAAQGRHIVKYSLSTKQGWEISTTLHEYYKVLMRTDVSVNTAEVAPPGPGLGMGPVFSERKGQIAYEAESDSGSDDEQMRLASGGTPQAAVTTFTPVQSAESRSSRRESTSSVNAASSDSVTASVTDNSVDPMHSSISVVEPVTAAPQSFVEDPPQPSLCGSSGGAINSVGCIDSNADDGRDVRHGVADGATSPSPQFKQGVADRLQTAMAEMLAAAEGGSKAPSQLLLEEYARVKKEIEDMQQMKREYELLRKNHAKLQSENEEVRKIVGDMYVSVDEDRSIREAYRGLYTQTMDSIDSNAPRTSELMPRIYDMMVRMNDEDIRREYITQMEIILNDDPSISEKVKGIAEGLSIKLGEMMDQPRHQRIAKLAKEEEERKKGMEQQQQSRKEAEGKRQKLEKQRELNRQAYEALVPVFKRITGTRPISLQGEQRRLAQRFQNRLELRMILMDLSALRMIGPGQYKSMGTGGLKNEEVRALHYRLSKEQELLNTSREATALVSMLERKVETLPLQIKEAEWAAAADASAAASAPKRRAPPPPPPGGPPPPPGRRPPPPPPGGPAPPSRPVAGTAATSHAASPPLHPALPPPSLSARPPQPPPPPPPLPRKNGQSADEHGGDARADLLAAIGSGASDRLRKTGGPGLSKRTSGLAGRVVEKASSTSSVPDAHPLPSPSTGLPAPPPPPPAPPPPPPAPPPPPPAAVPPIARVGEGVAAADPRSQLLAAIASGSSRLRKAPVPQANQAPKFTQRQGRVLD